MVIDMNEAQVSTVGKMREVLAGTQALEFRQTGDDAGRYSWIDAVLRRVDYRQLKRLDRGVVRAYLRHLSGYSRATLTRLVSRWMARKPLVKQYRAPEHAFARRYTALDVALLAEVDARHGHALGAGHGLRAAPPARCLWRCVFRAAGLDLGGASVQPTQQRRLP